VSSTNTPGNAPAAGSLSYYESATLTRTVPADKAGTYNLQVEFTATER
jgi:hypothetical protein